MGNNVKRSYKRRNKQNMKQTLAMFMIAALLLVVTASSHNEEYRYSDSPTQRNQRETKSNGLVQDFFDWCGENPLLAAFGGYLVYCVFFKQTPVGPVHVVNPLQAELDQAKLDAANSQGEYDKLLANIETWDNNNLLCQWDDNRQISPDCPCITALSGLPVNANGFTVIGQKMADTNMLSDFRV